MKRAWHAGTSEYKGREKCNDFSIGIELEGTVCTPYTEIQYSQLALISSSSSRVSQLGESILSADVSQ
jgi:AmpD protein